MQSLLDHFKAQRINYVNLTHLASYGLRFFRLQLELLSKNNDQKT